MLCWTVVLLSSATVDAFSVTTVPVRKMTTTATTTTRLYSNNNNSNNTNKPSGVYVRPSAAVERGSGFFVPGLEGPKVRLFVGTLLLVATGANHVLSANNSAFSEALAVLFSGLVLLQGAIESSKENRDLMMSVAESSVGLDSSSVFSTGSSMLSKQWSSSSSNTNQDWQDRVEWAATSFLSMTPATHMIVVKDDSIAFWLGLTKMNGDSSTTTGGAKAALETSQQSKGGRVALPSDHPVATGLFSNHDDKVYRKCMIVQRITPTACWVVASDDLLASFTKQDLQWLGRMADYVRDDDTTSSQEQMTNCFLTKGIMLKSLSVTTTTLSETLPPEDQQRQAEIIAADLEEMGGDPSFLMNLPGMQTIAATNDNNSPSLLDDPVANGGDGGFQTLEQEKREAEIAEIIEMGGDPSFLMDEAPDMNSINNNDNDEESMLDDPMANGGDDGFQTQEQAQREADIAELLELGGDPSFLMDAPVVPQVVLSKTIESNDQLSTDRVYSPEKFHVDPDELAALEAAGGDPFFLPALDGKPTFTSGESAVSSTPEPLDAYAEALEAMGGDPSFLDPPATSTSARDIFSSLEAGPPEGKEATAEMASDPSFLLQYVQNQGGSTGTAIPTSNADTTSDSNKSDSTPQNPRHFLRKSPITNEVLEDEILGDEEALLEVGGDPAFLDSFDEHADSDAYALELQRAEIEDVGGDPSFL